MYIIYKHRFKKRDISQLDSDFKGNKSLTRLHPIPSGQWQMPTQELMSCDSVIDVTFPNGGRVPAGQLPVEDGNCWDDFQGGFVWKG